METNRVWVAEIRNIGPQLTLVCSERDLSEETLLCSLKILGRGNRPQSNCTFEELYRDSNSWIALIN